MMAMHKDFIRKVPAMIDKVWALIAKMDWLVDHLLREASRLHGLGFNGLICVQSF